MTRMQSVAGDHEGLSLRSAGSRREGTPTLNTTRFAGRRSVLRPLVYNDDSLRPRARSGYHIRARISHQLRVTDAV